ncbi:MAG: response regulator [Deltaproteobacteria bacterium]|nr:response regulator [Deltaproteobacteria bacterium]
MTQPIRILVIDDEEVVLASVEKILKRDGSIIDKVMSAEAALEKIAITTYDVVIADLMLPGMNGLELLCKIREDKPDIPTIMITGFATIQSATQAMKIGAVEYLPKPFTRSELRGAVFRAIRRRSLPAGVRAAIAESGAVETRTGTSATTTEPGSVYRVPEHTWLKIDADGNVIVGMDPVFALTLGTLRDFELPMENELIEQGRTCLHAEDNEGIAHALCSPVSGRVLAVNDDVGKNLDLVLTDPEGSGWLFKVQPMDLETELESLVPD